MNSKIYRIKSSTPPLSTRSNDINNGSRNRVNATKYYYENDDDDGNYDVDDMSEHTSPRRRNVLNQSVNTTRSKPSKYVLEQDNYEDNEQNYAKQQEKQKFFLIDGKYYTNKPPSTNNHYKAMNKYSSSHQQTSRYGASYNSEPEPDEYEFSDYRYKVRPANYKATPKYGSVISISPKNSNPYPDYSHDEDVANYDASSPRQRVYQPRNKQNQNYYDQQASYRQPYSSQTVFNKRASSKPNHRREIEEPVIRDKPISNKPIIRGGFMVHK